ncbi:MAG TPA: FlgD immunoglobulin-like domain containing protein [Candidatus Saccharimonadaceae bacterium]|nr:FlgD immunoglobulin-like domain containing protein [Candidatus Saccharimonadaceae bacterium]
MVRARSFLVSPVALVLLFAAAPAFANWPHDPTVNLPLSSSLSTTALRGIAPDGSGGAIVVWHEFRSGSYDIIAQRVTPNGKLLWGATGLVVCGATGDQINPAVCIDGAGGAFIVWQDHRSGTNDDIYATHVTAAGVPDLTPDGVAVCTAVGDQQNPVIAAVNGHAIMAWRDLRAGNGDIYASDIYSLGPNIFPANGAPVCTNASNQLSPAIAADPFNGCHVVWEDQRTDAGDIYYQRLGTSGTPTFAVNGIPICTSANEQRQPVIQVDPAFDVMMAWIDDRAGALSSDAYAQRLNSAGTAQWTANGLPICTAPGQQITLHMASDGQYGALFAWADGRVGGVLDVYAQHLDQFGAPQWTVDGVLVCGAPGVQTNVQIAPDGTGGALVTWDDLRSVSSDDIYAQRLSQFAVPLWTLNGVPTSSATGIQQNPRIVGDGAGGAIVAFEDARLGPAHPAAQRVDQFGVLGGEPAVRSVRDVLNDQGGQVKVSWDASPLDTDPLFMNVNDYLIFRSVPAAAAEAALREGRVSASAHAVREVHEAGARAPLLATTFGAAAYYWEYVGTQRAFHLATYSYVAPTEGDSVAGSNPRTAYFVRAEAGNGAEWWDSDPDSGYSVDNLAPIAPAPFTGQYSGGSTAMQWNPNSEADLAGYRLYRGTNVSFVPSPANEIAELTTTTFTDAGAGAPYVYKLVAVDVHGNASPVSMLIPDGALDVQTRVPTALFLAPPMPNPARAGVATVLRFGLPAAGRVRFSVFDVHGREVRVLEDGVFEAGEHTATWDGRDGTGRRVAAGMYFVRLATASGERDARVARVE